MILLILGLNFMLLLGCANYLLMQRRQINSLVAKVAAFEKASQSKVAAFEKASQQILQDHPMLINADLIFSRQLAEINRQLISMDNQLQNLENQRDNDGGYQHALKILEMGGNREEIVGSCHLSSAEADLLMNLQAYRSAMKAT